ncbi:MAG: hypothetical protein ABW169_16765 [Sphingobium sp.]
MSLIPAGLVSGPSLLPQPPLIPPVSAPQPVDSASQSKTDSGTSGQQGGASTFLSQGGRESRFTYDRPAAPESSVSSPAPASGAQGFVSPSVSSGTAAADAAAVNAPLATAEPTKTPAYAAAATAYAMIADASPGMPPSVLTPLRGS